MKTTVLLYLNKKNLDLSKHVSIHRINVLYFLHIFPLYVYYVYYVYYVL